MTPNAPLRQSKIYELAFATMIQNIELSSPVLGRVRRWASISTNFVHVKFPADAAWDRPPARGKKSALISIQ
jgi:hypothetical protein